MAQGSAPTVCAATSCCETELKRRSIVTGGSQGIGLAAVRSLLHEHHANVVALSRHGSTELDAEKEQAKGSLTILRGDVADDETNQLAVVTALQQYSRLDALVLSAGLSPLARLADLTFTDARNVIDVQLNATLSILTHALKHLRASRGKVIMLGSGAARGKIPAQAPYSAAHAGKIALASVIALEEPDVVTLVFNPGATDTNNQALIRQTGRGVLLDEHYARYVALHEEGRLNDPGMIGRIVAKLAVEAKPDLSGKFVTWNDEELEPYR